MLRWAILLSSGCSQLLGIDELAGPDLPDGDVVRLELQLQDVGNDPQGQPTAVSHAPVAEDIEVTLADGSHPTVSLVDNKLVFAVPVDERYAALLKLPRGAFEIQSTQRELVWVDVSLGRPDRELVSGSTLLQVSPVPTDPTMPAPGTFSFLSTGVWQQGGASSMDGATFTTDWAESFSIDGGNSLGLLSGARGDRLAFVHQSTAFDGPLTKQIVDQAQVESIEQPASGMVSLSANLSPILRESRVFAIQPDKRILELSSAFPSPSPTPPTEFWTLSVRESPVVQRAESGHTLALATSSDTTFSSVELQLGQVFGLPRYAQYIVGLTRMADAQAGVSQSAVLLQTATLDNVDFVSPTVGVPLDIILGDTSIRNGNVVELPADDRIRFSWPAVALADFYSVTVTSLEDNQSQSYVSVEPFVEVPRERLRVGARYQVNLVSQQGYPGAAAGDFATRELPSNLTSVQMPFEIR